MSLNNRRHQHLALVEGVKVDTMGDGRTVGEFLDDWLWGKQALRPSTHASYESHIRLYLVPYLGNLDLEALRPLHIERMFREIAMTDDRRGRPLSPASIRRIHATLMSALNTAVRRGMLDRNPAVTVELPKPPKSRTVTWSPQDLSRFLDAISDDPLHLLFQLLGLVGLRRGEVVALRWQDVDLNRGLLRVEQSMVNVGGKHVLGPPKSAAGARTVALDDETTRRLHWHQSKQQLEVLRVTGSNVGPELVFTHENGDPLDPTWVSRHFDRLVKRHGLPRIRLHDLRHTSASIGLAAGESLVEVSRRLGHSSITVTADIYSHISPLVAKESAERLARTVFQP